MEALGDKLRFARESKGISIEQAARETYIARKFIESMETERFDVFPGESYLLGFLRSYSEYLEFESEELVNLYKNMRIQEQPAPIDELLDNKGPSAVSVVGGVFFGLLIIAALIFLVPWSDIFAARPATTVNEVPHEEAPTVVEDTTSRNVYTLKEEFLEQEFESGDILRLEDGNEVTLVIVNDNAAIMFADQNLKLEQQSKVLIDIDGDQRNDLGITFNEATEIGAVIRFDRVIESPLNTLDPIPLDIRESETRGLGSTTQPARVRKSMVILEGTRKKNFDYLVTFQQAGFARIQVDEQPVEEGYMVAGKSFPAGGTAGKAVESLKLWLTNAGSTKLTINGSQIKLGGPGEVLSWQVGWIEAGAGLYNLELIPMY